MIILVISIGLDILRESLAVRAAEILRRSVALNAEVLRDGAFAEGSRRGRGPGSRDRAHCRAEDTQGS